VAYLAAIETGSFGSRSLIARLSLDVCGVVILRLGRVCVGIVALVLASVIWGSGSGQVHWYLDVVVHGSRHVGGVVLWSLLLLLLLWSLLILLGSSPPSAWSELILVLSERVVESSWIGDSSPGSDEFNHLSSFGYVDCSGLVFVVGLWNWEFDDFV
jgi:hypothetical protein